jgi:hypothetical protein
MTMPRGACTFRQRDVEAAVKAVRKAGVPIAKVEIEGKKIVVITGAPNGAEPTKQEGAEVWNED